ncbi:hypothetical protein [Ruegeria sp. A3M17]|uniref:hypothetical protein n=1 Tax=Ruegeria sp. A3M17 TaxID=2267229 RepID=UPI0018F6B2EF|nr:hypothetical protein [Ruegeria sp. A3M17]
MFSHRIFDRSHQLDIETRMGIRAHCQCSPTARVTEVKPRAILQIRLAMRPVLKLDRLGVKTNVIRQDSPQSGATYNVHAPITGFDKTIGPSQFVNRQFLTKMIKVFVRFFQRPQPKIHTEHAKNPSF